MDTFKAAVFVFWISFFANLRGCAPKLRSALFAQLVTTTTGKTLEWLKENSKSCLEIFNKIHDAMLQKFAQNLTDMCDHWLESDAGEYYRLKIQQARYARNN